MTNSADSFTSLGSTASAVVEKLKRSSVMQNEIEPREDQAAVQLPSVATQETTAFLSLIERIVRDPSIDIDRIDKMLDVQERLIAKRAKQSYIEAFSQLALPVIERHGEIKITAANIQSYAKWEDVNEKIGGELRRLGFALSFRVSQPSDGQILVTGILSHKDGHSEETSLALPYDKTGSKNAVQSAGSTISYGKRYVAGLLLNFTSRDEDDDGKNAGSGETINDEQLEQLHKALLASKSDIDKFCQLFKIEALSDLPVAKFKDAMARIAKKMERAAA